MPDTYYIDFAAAPVRPTSSQTSHGSVDWEMIFEHPETGFLSCVLRAQTPQTLRNAVNTMISEIYLRQTDGAEKDCLSNRFDGMIGDEMDLDQLRIVTDAILSRFRKIKEYRKDRQRSAYRT